MQQSIDLRYQRYACFLLRNTFSRRQVERNDAPFLHRIGEVLNLRRPYRYSFKNLACYCTEGGEAATSQKILHAGFSFSLKSGASDTCRTLLHLRDLLVGK